MSEIDRLLLGTLEKHELTLTDLIKSMELLGEMVIELQKEVEQLKVKE